MYGLRYIGESVAGAIYLFSAGCVAKKINKLRGIHRPGGWVRFYAL